MSDLEFIYGHNINHDYHDMKAFTHRFSSKICVHKSGLLLVFHTYFDHTFAYYLTKPIKRMESMRPLKNAQNI